MSEYFNKLAVLRSLARVLSLAVAGSVAGKATAGDCTEAATVEEVAAGVYVRQGKHGVPFEDDTFANIGFIVGEQCVAVIDSGGSLDEGEAIKCAVAATTPLPVCYLVITHHHFDHTLGSLAFKTPSDTKPTQLIGHEKLAAALEGSAEYYLTQLSKYSDETLSKDLIVPPDQTVAVGEPLTLDLGGRLLQITAYPPAHTNNDLSVFDETTGALWLADMLFVEHVPTLDSSVGSLDGWLDAIATLKAHPAATAVPGHGPASVPWPGGVSDLERYLTTIRSETKRIIDEGGSLEHAQDTVGLAEQPKWRMFDLHHKRTVIKAFTELEWE